MKRGKASIAVIRAKGQITIPSVIRETAHLKAGDRFDVSITPDGILLRPPKLAAATQAWFWTPAWQKAEREASHDIRKGRMRNIQDRRGLLAKIREVGIIRRLCDKCATIRNP